MIAEKPIVNNKVQPLPDTIFAGLSFPTAPTNEILIQPKEIINKDTNEVNINENDRLIESKSTTNSNKSNLTSSITQSIVNTVKDIDRRVKSATLPPQDVKRQLSKLYAPNDTIDSSSHGNGTSIYPDLPETENLLSSNNNSIRSINTPITTNPYTNTVPMTYGQQSISGHVINGQVIQNQIYHPSTQHQGSAYTRAYENITTPATSSRYIPQEITQNQAHPSTAPLKEGNSLETEQLISDLILQNQKLTQEIETLRSLNGSATESSDKILGFEIDSPALGIAMSGAPDTTNSPAQGVKYICCGSCRHWFMTSKDIIYVLCPQCEAINNCGSKTDSNRNSTVSRSSSEKPWYLQCFK
mmetsp:Transcript_16784/g.15135  ORF Transcript_16784/g.15135 Transcript_16784/m.15135 type:complete len:357 (+) Transcript_16784:70-1140(+)